MFKESTALPIHHQRVQGFVSDFISGKIEASAVSLFFWPEEQENIKMPIKAMTIKLFLCMVLV